MANETQAQAKTTAPAANANGSTAGSATAKQPQRDRVVPAIALQPKVGEYAEIREALTEAMGGLEVDVSLSPFVLACALKYIRDKFPAAVKRAETTAPKYAAAYAADIAQRRKSAGK